MFPPPEIINTEIFTTIPKDLHRSDEYSEWINGRAAGPLPFFLEGPSFDREGHLYCVDLAHSRIFRIDPARKWSVFADYDGEPNGLKIHKDGRIFVADHRHGVLSFDPKTAEMKVVLSEAHREGFKGLNDLVFDSRGDLYFTDQGQSAIEDPTGRIYRLRSTGELDLLYKGLPGPNGLVLDLSEKILHIAVTRSNQIVSLPLRPNYGGIHKARMFIQLSGSPTGPDGMAIDEAGNIVVVQAGSGSVWMFNPMGEPIYRIKSCAGLRTTNVAFGGPDRRTLFITEAEHGVILKAKLPTPGTVMYGLS
jgi:gluconolactonase